MLLQIARLQAGQWLFINGATGAVGQAAMRIARGIGTEVVGRVRVALNDQDSLDISYFRGGNGTVPREISPPGSLICGSW